MTINLVKLCVGIESVHHLHSLINDRVELAIKAGKTPQLSHTTRMVPTRREELLSDGSLYWVIKGYIQARQKLTDIQLFTDNDGINRCNLIMDSELILTELQPRKAFQGWRYLKPEDTPSDMNKNRADKELDPEMRLELSELCLL